MIIGDVVSRYVFVVSSQEIRGHHKMWARFGRNCLFMDNEVEANFPKGFGFLRGFHDHHLSNAM